VFFYILPQDCIIQNTANHLSALGKIEIYLVSLLKAMARQVAGKESFSENISVENHQNDFTSGQTFRPLLILFLH